MGTDFFDDMRLIDVDRVPLRTRGLEPYGGLPPYQKNSDTSRAAALSMNHPSRAIREQVYRLVAARTHDYGITCDEAEKYTGLSHQTISARFRELVLAERIVDSGERRKTRSGRNANVYRLRGAATPAVLIPEQE